LQWIENNCSNLTIFQDLQAHHPAKILDASRSAFTDNRKIKVVKGPLQKKLTSSQNCLTNVALSLPPN
jgi:hypothetical protein